MNGNEVEIRKSAEEKRGSRAIRIRPSQQRLCCFQRWAPVLLPRPPEAQKKLNTHRWHVRRYAGRMPRPETFQAVAERNTITPNAFKKLVAKAFWTQQNIWPEKQGGIYFELKGRCRGVYYLATPADTVA